MGSQTVEILRQGVWASLTGGWFYDPHQNVFCNAIHLYLWLFLLCTPFVTYLYFSKAIATWAIYCLSTGITIAAVKIINLALHMMYDEAQIVSSNNLENPSKNPKESSGTDDGGIEMQILGGSSASNPNSRLSSTTATFIGQNGARRPPLSSNEMSQTNSAISIECGAGGGGGGGDGASGGGVDASCEQITSTIDLKVDVHRKNSSESSDSFAECSAAAIALDGCKNVDYRHKSMKVKSKSDDATATVKSPDSISNELMTRSEERRDKFVDMDHFMGNRCEPHKRRMRMKLHRQTHHHQGIFNSGSALQSESDLAMECFPIDSSNCSAPKDAGNRFKLNSRPFQSFQIQSSTMAAGASSSSSSISAATSNTRLRRLQNPLQPFKTKKFQQIKRIPQIGRQSPPIPLCFRQSNLLSIDKLNSDSDTEDDTNTDDDDRDDDDDDDDDDEDELLQPITSDAIRYDTCTGPTPTSSGAVGLALDDVPVSESQPSTSTGTTKTTPANTKSEDSGCPSSDCEQASASSKDMLLSREHKSMPSDRLSGEFEMDGGGGDRTADVPNEKVNESKGAIPKTHFASATTSTSSLSTAATPAAVTSTIATNDSENHRRKSLRRSFSSLSIRSGCDTMADSNLDHRDRVLPMSSNSRIEHIFPVTRKPYLCLHPSYGSMGIGSGWDFDIEVQESINTFIIQELIEDRANQNHRSLTGPNRLLTGPIAILANQAAAESMPIDTVGSGIHAHHHHHQQPQTQHQQTQTQQRTTASINRMGYADSVFWGHYNLPSEKQTQPKRYFNFPVKCFGHKRDIRISMDRLQLLALFDRDLGWCQTILSILLAAMVSILGSIVLGLGIYRDLFAFIFSFVIASSQFSLLKSVQPDASSPVHGFNKTVAYSRPIYFCICSTILIIAYQLSSASSTNPTTTTATATTATAVTTTATNKSPALPNTLALFGMPFATLDFFRLIQETMAVLLLMLPLLFSFGLFPQINTFLMYVLEQVDMHTFGGNAVCSLSSAFFAIFRSMLGCCILYGFAFGALCEPRSTQHILFSCFCALIVATSYHLSRSASDFTYLWAIIKSSLALHVDDDDSTNGRSDGSASDDDAINNVMPNNKDNVVVSNDDTNDGGYARTTANKTKSISMDGDVNGRTANDKNGNDQRHMDDDDQQKSTTVNREDLDDPLPGKLKSTVNARLKNDFLVCIVIGALVFSLHSSTVFTVLQPELNPVLQTFAIILGFLLHYVLPQMRKYLPWLCFAKPILKQKEYGLYETSEAAHIMWFEKVYVCLTFFERNVLLPLVFISALTSDSATIVHKFGVPIGTMLVVLCGIKSIRYSYSDPSSQFIVILFSVLFFRFDYVVGSETFLIDFFFMSIVYKKTCEFLLKLQFIVTYIAPWQITWGSAFHAFAQPFSVPHSAMLFLQAAISAILSTPLNPFLGSAIFLTSYARPIKFWERDYNTRRIDHSNTRLSSQLERDLGADDNNLNSIFYEHLTRSLQHSLCGDLLMGRWGNVSQGDCFVLASDYLNCLVHIIELGNGLCTFQMRGLEFRGTYCQQREVEAISEGIEENDGCCCCSPGHLPNMLSVNAMFSTRWLAWQVVASQYILEGYSISDNLAQATLQVFEFRKVLITYYIKSIIYYAIRSPKLQSWLTSPTIQEALQSTLDRQFVDLDPIFNHNLDEDFDFRASGITRYSFCATYMDWIKFCYAKRPQSQASKDATSTEQMAEATKMESTPPMRLQPMSASTLAKDQKLDKEDCGSSSIEPTPSPRPPKSTRNAEASAKATAASDEDEITRKSSLISLLLALGLLARRTLATATHTHSSLSGVEFFLHGLHALFKGDFRITSPRDEWVFADMDLLHSVVAPAVKMSLKLHQDHFLSPDEYEDPVALYDAITMHTMDLVISHEADPLWRSKVLRGAPQLLALRHVMEDGSDEYRLIRLSKRFLSFRVIKLNRECVRGLWAGQQQELIYLRNRNPERGSIQNAKQALRNIINSSCDQPIGYPIYVSPLTTSYAETNEQLCKIIGGAITFEGLKNLAFKFCQRVRQRCREGCSSGSATMDTEMGDMQGIYSAPTPNNTLSGTTATLSYGSQSLSGTGNRGSLASMCKPNSSTLLAGFLNREREQERETMMDRGAGVYRKRGSAMSGRTSAGAGELVQELAQVRENWCKNWCHERSAACGSSGPDPNVNRDGNYLKQTMGSDELPSAASHRMRRPNNSLSSSNLSSRDACNRMLSISCERKSKSEERQSYHDHDGPAASTISNSNRPFVSQLPIVSDSDAAVSDLLSLSRAPVGTCLDVRNKTSPSPSPPPPPPPPPLSTLQTSWQYLAHGHAGYIGLPLPPKINMNRKVIIVDSTEIYDCLDLGRRIDVVWPNETMRMAGGRSSWKEWTPKEGMVGYIVHYWQPNHPNHHFRSNFNRTVFLIQIGEHFVPVSENGVREYNTIGDERIRIVHMPKNELRLIESDSDGGGYGSSSRCLDTITTTIDEENTASGGDDISDNKNDTIEDIENILDDSPLAWHDDSEKVDSSRSNECQQLESIPTDGTKTVAEHENTIVNENVNETNKTESPDEHPKT